MSAKQARKLAAPPKAGAEIIRKLPKTLARLTESDVRLDLAYRYWFGLRPDNGLLPARSRIENPAFRFLVCESEFIAVEHPNPHNWNFQGLAGSERKRSNPAVTRTSFGTWLDTLRSDCRTMRYTGSPLFQEIELCSPPAHFDLLILPLAEDSIHVDNLLIIQAGIDVVATEN